MPTYEDLKALQSEPLERKIRITLTRIIEWYQHYNGQVYISFSGGKDSTVLLDIARKLYPDIEAVFINTGLEYPEIVDFVKTKENVKILRPKKTFKQVIEGNGYPIISKEVSNVVEGARRGQTVRLARLHGTLKDKEGNASQFNIEKFEYLFDAPFKISDKCCAYMKKQPANAFTKSSGKKPITAMMADESQKRLKAWLKTGCNAFDMEKPQSQPMSFWTEQDVLHYLKLFNIPYCSVYGEIVPDNEYTGQTVFNYSMVNLKTTECSRTGCMFCAFGIMHDKEPNRFQRMKETHPKIYDYCMRETGLGMAKVLDFINVKY